MAQFAAATMRAYRGDLKHIDDWAAEYGLTPDDLDERRVFAYCTALIRGGATVSTLRRRLSALKALLPGSGAEVIGMSHLRRLEAHASRRDNDSERETTTVLVLSDDPIIRAGLASVLTQAGVLCWSDSTAGADAATLSTWNYVLLWLPGGRGVDRFSTIERIRALGADATTQVPVIVIHPGDVSDLVRLRMVEAGARYAIPHEWLAGSIHSFPSRLASADIPLRYHLETPLALRERLGLALAGDIGELLDHARLLPAAAWTGFLPLQHLAISRAASVSLRRDALELGGIPAPEFMKYANSRRRPPELPEWSRVRDVVREAMGIPHK